RHRATGGACGTPALTAACSPSAPEQHRAEGRQDTAVPGDGRDARASTLSGPGLAPELADGVEEVEHAAGVAVGEHPAVHVDRPGVPELQTAFRRVRAALTFRA